jgi:hypothetical protein
MGPAVAILVQIDSFSRQARACRDRGVVIEGDRRHPVDVPTGYPAEYERDLSVGDGRHVLIGPITPVVGRASAMRSPQSTPRLRFRGSTTSRAGSPDAAVHCGLSTSLQRSPGHQYLSAHSPSPTTVQ